MSKEKRQERQRVQKGADPEVHLDNEEDTVGGRVGVIGEGSVTGEENKGPGGGWVGELGVLYMNTGFWLWLRDPVGLVLGLAAGDTLW